MGSSHILKAFFESVEKEGFFNVSYTMLAQTLNMDENSLREVFPKHTDFLKALHGEIESTLLEEFQEDLPEMSLKDKLFDLLMRRIEVLDPYRQGVSRFIRDGENIPPDLKLLPILATIVPLMMQGMENSLRSINSEEQVWRKKNRAFALLIVYLLVLHTWAEDETSDLSSTMHALDKYLDLFTEHFGSSM